LKLSLSLPTDHVTRVEEFVTGRAVAEMAVAAEAAGFDSVAVTDHPFPDDPWLQAGGHHALDPLVALSFAAAATTKLRVRTNLYIAAYRNPFVSAKAVASLQQLSDNRIETAWTPAIVFAYLVLILVFRPQGLLGERTREAG